MIPSWASCHLLLPISASSAVKLADLSTYHPVQICPTTSLKGSALGSDQISRIFKRLAAKSGMASNTVCHISGHSMRVGAAQDLLKSGASLPVIMNRGRWTKVYTVMRYVDQAANQMEPAQLMG